MPERIGTVIIGGGQAGLSVSRELAQAGVRHVVLERGRVGQSWRGRWDSFCLVTPNWSVQLPGHPYDGHDPDGFMPRDELVRYLERYASAIGAPVREGVEVRSVRPQPGGDFALATSAGDIVASHGGPVHRRVPAAAPPGGRGHAPGRPAPDRRGGLPEPGRAAAGPGAGGRKRPVRLPDRRGAARGRPGRPPGLRASRVGPTADRRPRRRLVAPGGRRFRRPGGRAAGPGRPAGGQPAGVWAGRRPRPALPDAAADGRDAARPLPRRRGPAGPVRPRPRRERGLRRSAKRKAHGRLSEGRRQAGAAGAGDPRPRADRHRHARAGGPERARRGGLRRRASGPTTARGSTARAPSTSSGFRSTRRAPARWLPGSTSQASTSCGSASRRSSSAWARTPQSLPRRSASESAPRRRLRRRPAARSPRPPR